MNINRNSSITAYILVAAIISLVVNFSYLLLLVVNQEDNYSRRTAQERGIKQETSIVEQASGRLSLSVDGFGYILTESGDSIYVDRGSVRRLYLKAGDELDVETGEQARYDGAHPIMTKVINRNGEPFDYGAVYSAASRVAEMTYQILFYFLVSFVLMFVMNMRHRRADWRVFAERGVVCTIITVAVYFLAPVTLRFSGETVLVYQSPHIVDFVVIMKCLFMLVTVLLYSQIYVLTSQRQQMVLENEQLKNENLTTRYNMLVSQINPHFFFNSLNSLAMLVREKDERRALEYINQLSYTFRYITQNGSNTLVTIRDELEFARAYCYLFKIRYADKIFFDIDVGDELMNWQLPALSLQPLIGNAVKHNAITSKHPFRVKIHAVDDGLVVENEHRPMLEAQIGTGTGLKNLSSRYKLIVGRDIEITNDDKRFVVWLPLVKPSK
ncbi:MAG: sensor histidine kinase [Alistipes sp.]